MSQGVGTVGVLDGRVDTLVAPFADGVKEGMGSGDLCCGTNGTDRREGARFLMLAEGLAVAVLDVREDGEVDLKAAPGVEEVKGPEAEILVVDWVGDSKDWGQQRPWSSGS